MESAYDDRQLAQVSADMLLDERGEVEAVRVAEEVPIPGAKSKYRIVYIKDRLGNVTAPRPKPAPRPAAAVPTVPPPKVYVPKRPVGRIPDLPRRPRPPSPLPDPAPLPAKSAAKRRPGMDKKAASHLSRQLVLYILIAGGLALGAMAATTFAKQIIRLLVPG
jgi:hypothetical protein